jgi:hypothetical protein
MYSSPYFGTEGVCNVMCIYPNNSSKCEVYACMRKMKQQLLLAMYVAAVLPGQ